MFLQGVWEDDPIRKDDSFNTFEEIFSIAKSWNVDFVLLGGDLFHDHKPSKQTIVKAIDILKKGCLHDKDVTFQVVSDQSKNFTTGCVDLCLLYPAIFIPTMWTSAVLNLCLIFAVG